MKNSLFDLETVRDEAKKRLASKDEKHLGVPQAKVKKELKKLKEKVEHVNEHAHEEKKVQKKVVKKVNELEQKFEEHKKKSPKKTKKIVQEVIDDKPAKNIKKMKEAEEEKPVGGSVLSKVQAIRKEKGISLKDAWAEYKKEI
jgi:hypothetical protein